MKNPWEIWPGILSATKHVYQALKSPNLELFVVNDFFMSATALLADYVLPIASWMERDYLEAKGGVAMGGESVIPPLGEQKNDYTFWRELSIRCGYKEHWPWESMKELAAYRLEPLGMSWEEFVQAGAVLGPPPKEKQYEKLGFAPPSGKCELSSSILEKLGYDSTTFL